MDILLYVSSLGIVGAVEWNIEWTNISRMCQVIWNRDCPVLLAGDLICFGDKQNMEHDSTFITDRAMQGRLTGCQRSKTLSFVMFEGHICIRTDQGRDCYTKERVHLYDGTRNVSRTGRPCRRWADVRDNSKFPMQTGESLEDAVNYCRTEKNPPDRVVYPWCYVPTMKRWEFCSIGPCETYSGTDCLTFSENDDGYEIVVYKGTSSTTASGHTCKPWASGKRFTTGESTAEAANYCRVVVGDEVRVPWCYTTNRNIRWEICNIMPCFK